MSITVAALSKVWTVFACSNTEVLGSNRTGDVDVCVRLFYVCVVLYEYVGSDRLCGLVVRVIGYRTRGPGSITGTTRFSEK
jgi:hypothetical protein